MGIIMVWYRDNYVDKMCEHHIDILSSWDQVHDLEADPECEIWYTTDFSTHGANYSERKANARYIALSVSQALSACAYSYMELAIITQELERLARRYGLVREFKENCII